MNDDRLDTLLRTPPTPLPTPPGAFAAIAERARRRRVRRRGVVAAGAATAAVVLTVVGVPVVRGVLEEGPRVGVPAGPPAACDTGRLRAEPQPVQASASTRTLTVFVWNEGTRDCRLATPDVDLVDADGARVDVPVVIGRLTPDRFLADVVEPDRGVTLTISWRVVPGDPGADPDTDCLRAESLALTVTPGTDPVPLDVSLTACERGSLLVTPFDVLAG